MAIIDNLRIRKDAMQDAINKFESKKTALENTYLKISNEVRQLDSTWNGEASETFKSQFEALYKNLQQNETVMSNIISKLKEALERYTEADEQAKAAIEKLDEFKAYINNL